MLDLLNGPKSRSSLMPQKELERLQAVHRFLNIEINETGELQEIVELVSELCKMPIALITLIDEDTQYFKFKVGIDLDQNIREDTFCAYLINGDIPMVVEDAMLDSRFVNSRYVAGIPHIRFYAGAPLITHDGHTLGSLCVLDVNPRRISYAQQHLLVALAKRVIQIMEFNFSLHIVKKQFLQSEMKLQSFFESAGVCHLLIGKEMEVIAFNKTMADFLERVYHIQLYAGIKIDHVFKYKQLDSFLAEYREALKGVPLKYERKVDYTGETIWWYVTFEPAYNPQGEIIGASYNAIDISERKHNEKQIMTQNESLINIAYIQSHELRKPVASILGLMNLFKLNDYTATKEELIIMEKATKELDNKIRTIVNFTEL
jgi:PAS domain S-box-containing protein